MLDLTASRPRVAPAGHAPAQLALAVHGAIGAALRRVPDLVLTEVDVPLSGGIEATRRIKAELPATHVVMLTPGPPEQRPGPFSPPPPDREASLTEIAVLGELAAERDAAAIDGINYWNTGAPAFRWNNRTVQLLLAKGITVPRASRAMALLNVAIHDATVAAWDTKYTYNRARPADFERGFVSAIPTPASPAYPSEHAVTAGAAEAVLSYLFPDDAVMVNGWAEEAGRSRTLAGTDYPSDVAAGLELRPAGWRRRRRLGKKRRDDRDLDGHRADWAGYVGRHQLGGAAGRHLEDLGAQRW